jgi:uncharacterized protein RhaS with RHS repeats
MYRRNRYYDPKTGRFTQEDPIGLAGGLNTYGFADGDPVSYSDPYGLCPNPLARGLGSLACAMQDIVGAVQAGPSMLWNGLGRVASGGMWAAQTAVRRTAQNPVVQEVGMEVLTGGMGIFVTLGRRTPRVVQLVDGMTLKVDDALDAAADFLGAGYKELAPGRFRSADGTRQVRMQDGDILGRHGSGPHMNFEVWKPDPKRPGREVNVSNTHVELEGK